MTIKDNHQPSETWEFDESVTQCFDDMLKRSIPGYFQMRDLVYLIGSTFLKEGSVLCDIGASRGESSARFINNFPTVHAILNEVSPPMLEVLHSRYADHANITVNDFDLRSTEHLIREMLTQKGSPSLILSILTMIFIPVNYRPQIFDAIYKSLDSGGAFIMVEKVLGNSGTAQQLLVDAYHQYKHSNGYSWEDIERKKLSLEGVQVPLQDNTNIEMLRSSGFRVVESFWRNLNFVGYVAIKE